MNMIDLLPWHWLVLSILLLIAEVLGAGGFLIGLAIAALIQSLVTFFFLGLDWDFQLLIFAVNSIAFTLIYWKFLRKFNQRTDIPNINDRAAQLVGRHVEITEPILHGEGKVQIGDALWKTRCQQPLPQGSLVKVVGSEGMVLIVELVTDKA